MLKTIAALARSIDSLLEWALFDVALHRRHRLKLTVAAGALLLAVALCWHAPNHPSSATNEPPDPSFLLHRPWFTALPNSWESPYSLYYFTDHQITRDRFYAIYETGTPAKATFFSAGHRSDSPTLSLFWFFTKSDSQTAYRISRGHFGQFDLKLELSADPQHANAPRVFYSRIDRDFCAFDAAFASHLAALSARR